MEIVKVIVEVKVPENFQPCENNHQIYEQYVCPFAYHDADNGCNTCDYGIEDCPIKSMRFVQ